MKIDWLTKENPLLVEGAKAKRKFHPALTVLFYIGLLFLAERVSAITYQVITGSGKIPLEIHNYLLVISIAVYCLFVAFVEKRPLRSMGFVRRRALSGFLKGAGLGIAIYVVTGLVAMLFFGARFAGIGQNFSAGAFFLILGSFIIQGLAEEVGARGYMLVSMTNRMNAVWAVVLTTAVFAAIHLMGGNRNILDVVILLIPSLILSLYFLRSGNIWAAGGLHCMINFAGNHIINYDIGGNGSQALLTLTLPEGSMAGPTLKIIMFGMMALFCVLILLIPKHERQQCKTKSCGDPVS